MFSLVIVPRRGKFYLHWTFYQIYSRLGNSFSMKVCFLEAVWRYGALPASKPDSWLAYMQGRRNRGVWGDNVPPLFGPGGTGGGTMKMIFASTAFSTVEVTEFQLP